MAASGGNRSHRDYFYFLLTLTACFGLVHLPFYRTTQTSLLVLKIHVILGSSALVWMFARTVRSTAKLLGWRPAIVRTALYVVILGSFLLPLTGAMILGWTAMLFLLDWRLTRRFMRRAGMSEVQIRAAKEKNLNFVMISQSMLTGFYVFAVCVSFLLIFHRMHVWILPFLFVWLVVRPRVRAGGSRPFWIGAATVLTAFVGMMFYWKQIASIDPLDLSHPQVHRAVESKAERLSIKPMDPQHLSDSASCGTANCHPTLVKQWRGSSHRFTTNNVFFQKVVARLVETEGAGHVRMCINCHDPIGAMSQDSDDQYAAGRIDNPEGISCKACHLIIHYDEERGNGLYTLKSQSPYPFDGAPEGSEERSRHNRAIRLDPRMHLRDFRRRGMYREGDYCGACHLVTVPEGLTGSNSFHLHNLFEQWEQSPWEDHLNCIDCHLPRFQMDENGYTFFDHRLMGMNLDLKLNALWEPEDLPYIDDFSSFTKRVLLGDLAPGKYPVIADPDLYMFRKNPVGEINPLLMLYSIREFTTFKKTEEYLQAGPIIQFEATLDETADPRTGLGLLVATTNARVGHNFPSGPIDVQEIWLEVLWTDEEGNAVTHIGGMDERHYIDPAAPYLGSRGIVDAQGNQLLYHEFWLAARVVDKRVLRALETTEDRIVLPLSDNAASEYRLTVKWNFRRMNQRLADWVWPDQDVTMTVLTLDQAEYRVRLMPRDDGLYQVETTLLKRPHRAPISYLQP